MIDEYVKALRFQLSSELAALKKPLSSVYFGGGTPTTLSFLHFESIFELFKPHLAVGAEITVEANPSSLDKEKARALAKMGANRLSLGVQSLNDEKLSFLSRAHDKKGALRAYLEAREAGFDNISVDIIYDTPFDAKDFLMSEIKEFAALGAEHISAYSLTIEEGTPFEKKGIKPKEESLSRFVAKLLIEAGYEHYEVSSFAKVRSKHNYGYWEKKEYIGVGAGAVGCVGSKRLYPHSSVEEYIKEPLFAQKEEITKEEERMERIFLGLRSDVGVDMSLLNGKEGQIEELLTLALVKKRGDKLYATDFFLADELAVRLS